MNTNKMILGLSAMFFIFLAFVLGLRIMNPMPTDPSSECIEAIRGRWSWEPQDLAVCAQFNTRTSTRSSL